MRTTKDNKPVVATEMVATTLKALPFTAVPKTDRRLAKTNTYVKSNGVMIPFRTWALTTKETRLPGARATPAR